MNNRIRTKINTMLKNDVFNSMRVNEIMDFLVHESPNDKYSKKICESYKFLMYKK